MEKNLAERVERMGYSQTFVMTNKARALRAKGLDIISLTLGEPDFPVPDFVKTAAITAIEENYNGYSPVSGYLELRERICQKFQRDNQITYHPNQIVVSNGAKQSIINVLLSVVNRGDQVIIPAPYWVSYLEMVKMVGAQPIELKTSIENDFKLTPEALERAITPQSKAIMFSTPCNPSGSFYTEQEIRALGQVIARYPHLTVISDEIYEYINFSGKHFSMASIPALYNQVATINGMSKAYAMMGWRIGYMGAPDWLAAACDKIQGQMTSGANTIAQRASMVALDRGREAVASMVDVFAQRRKLMLDLVRGIKGFHCNEPQGAFYLFPDISYYLGKTLNGKKINNADDFAMFLLEDAHVATVGGVSFGDERCIRFSYASAENQLIKAMDRIKTTLENAEISSGANHGE